MREKISDGTYSWKELEEGVVQEKYRALCDFLKVLTKPEECPSYTVMELVRGQGEDQFLQE